ncbi:MAG: Fic family protein [Woeseiaceae bacterium]|nr:Fic family protein [Woeseiaceae bacterium]
MQLQQLSGRRRLHGTTTPELFFDLKYIFQMMESLGSSRIEGNRTTIADLVDARIENPRTKDEKLHEISNIDAATEFIESEIRPGDEITHAHVREAHKIIVDGLALPPKGEGDATPGRYREQDVAIAGAKHRPPSYPDVLGLMDELLSFLNDGGNDQFAFIRVALVHHRFTWIHPFTNGNGRTVRLITYASLIQKGFNVADGRIINPGAVFFSDRDTYNNMLAAADAGTEDGLLMWCRYVLEGLLREFQKIDRLLDIEDLRKQVLIPAIKQCRRRGEIDATDERILLLAAEEQIIAARDVHALLKKTYQTAQRRMRKLKDRKLLCKSAHEKQHYRLAFANNALMRSVVSALQSEGFFKGLDESDFQ